LISPYWEVIVTPFFSKFILYNDVLQAVQFFISPVKFDLDVVTRYGTLAKIVLYCKQIIAENQVEKFDSFVLNCEIAPWEAILRLGLHFC
jgi:hypothetical protein